MLLTREPASYLALELDRAWTDVGARCTTEDTPSEGPRLSLAYTSQRTVVARSAA